MKRLRRLVPRTVSFREAAATIFALVAILPLLVFLYLLSRTELLSRGEAQGGLLMALVIAVLGFLVFRSMADQVTRLAGHVRVPPAADAAMPLAPTAPVPGIGRVAEIGQIADAFNGLLEDLRGSTQRLEDLVFKLGTLSEMAEVAARIPTIEDLLSLVLQSTMRAVRATTGSIMLLDGERRTLRTAVGRGLPADAAAEIAIGQGIAGKVAELGEPILVDDIESDPRFGQASDPQYGNGSFLCAPVRAGDRLLGVINLVRKGSAGGGRPVPFGATDLQFLSALMTYIGYAIENARLLEDTQRSAAQLSKAVEDLKATQAQLVRGETLHAIGQLASGMAHHLNNLFAVISGRVQLLLMRIQEPEVRRYLEIVHRTVLDGADVVRRVQRFSRVQPVSEPTAVNLNQLAGEVVELTRPRWQDEAQLQGIVIEVAVIPGEIPPVPGEVAPLREVLMNLLFNAIDALPRGGRITITTWASGPWVACSVADDGVGMAEDARRRAFEPFFTTKGPKSTGLGLSVNYGIVERHGGQLTLESAEGAGTTVTIRLPIGPGEPLAPEAPAVPGAPPAPPVPLRVLVVDDEIEVRRALADMLRADGHTVVEAASGREALAALEGEAPVDVVLTDLGMPEMTGWDVTREVKARRPDLPIGLITGWGEQQLTGDERARVSFVLTKPVELPTLRDALGRLRLAR